MMNQQRPPVIENRAENNNRSRRITSIQSPAQNLFWGVVLMIVTLCLAAISWYSLRSTSEFMEPLVGLGVVAPNANIAWSYIFGVAIQYSPNILRALRFVAPKGVDPTTPEGKRKFAAYQSQITFAEVAITIVDGMTNFGWYWAIVRPVVPLPTGDIVSPIIYDMLSFVISFAMAWSEEVAIKSFELAVEHLQVGWKSVSRRQGGQSTPTRS